LILLDKIAIITRPATVASRIVIYERGDLRNVKFEWGNQICILCGRPDIDTSPRERKVSTRSWLAQLAKIFPEPSIARVYYPSVNALPLADVQRVY
jgi:hypothetical protein